MSTLFIILCVLALFHFIYESIILPTLRLGLRYRLFILRDKLAILRAERENKSNTYLYSHVENSINVSIRHIPYMTISLMFEANSFFKRNPEIADEIDKRLIRVNNIEDLDLKSLYNKSIHYGSLSVIYNCGAWILYLLPLFIIYIILKFLGLSMFTLKSGVQKLAVTPEHQFNRFSHVEENLYC